jgi:adenosylcobyric acid synthase
VNGRLVGGLMVCGTTSDAGKSTLVAGLCRWLARRGVAVAPFKAQNMSLNSAVTVDGGEIGRAQALQAWAAGVEPEVAMNPVLLKPTGERTCQVVVAGRPWRVCEATAYHETKPQLLPAVVDAYRSLRERFDVVLCEGAGSPAEINLFDRDIVNLRLAEVIGVPALLVGDINLGGVFASLVGTVELLPPRWRELVRGFVINKLRGDPDLLRDGATLLEARTGVPVVGVLPWIEHTWLDAEDSMALERPMPAPRPASADELDVAVVRLPRISNATDLDALRLEAGVRLRWVHDAAGLGDPDLVILPGSKATVADLLWLRERGLDAAIPRLDATVIGICAGYQMLGDDLDDRVESGAGTVAGLGLLPVRTVFDSEKVTRVCRGTAWVGGVGTSPTDESGRYDGAGLPVHGYQIHHGRVRPEGGEPFVVLDEPAGERLDGVGVGAVFGTTVHGLFDGDVFRRRFLELVAARRGKRWVSDGVSFAEQRAAAIDRVADAIEQHLDLAFVESLIRAAAPLGVPGGIR